MLKRSDHSFDDRKKEILGAIVRSHIATGSPIGSKSLTTRSSESLSSATIRNICAELEDEGYLTHPHTSAGRVPTDKGYRYYVDNLMVSGRVSRSDAIRINERLLDEDSLASPERLMERTSRLLSQLSDNVGIVITPLVSREMLHHIEFVKLADLRILVITVSTARRVRNCVIKVDEEFSQDELNSTARYLIENFRNMTLDQIREELLNRMTEEKALYDKLLRNAVMLCSRSLQDGDEPDVFIEGASNIISKQDFSGADGLRALLKMFEQKGRIIKILNECIDSGRLGPVAVRIGSENRLADMRSCTVIASRCFYQGGGIGVVGLTRMEYDRLISLVDYTAKVCERALSAGGFSSEVQRADG